jgi:hypothetical protein
LAAGINPAAFLPVPLWADSVRQAKTMKAPANESKPKEKVIRTYDRLKLGSLARIGRTYSAHQKPMEPPSQMKAKSESG